MAGGVGSRFWPLSREEKPKQFLDILGIGKSFIRQTYERFLPLVKSDNIFIATNEGYRDLVKQHIPELSDNQIILEPMRRNTAPCVAYATNKIKAINPEAIIIVAPSDHFITDEKTFIEVLKESCDYAANNDALMTIGIKPTRPETGYGYIQYGEMSDKNEIYKVKTFTEKPNLEMAMVFLDSGEFIWNSGIFVWSVRSITSAFREYQPELESAFEAGGDVYNTPNESEFVKRVFSECVSTSIDYAIMEKAANVYVTKADFGWSDVGTWSSLYDNSDKDASGNALNHNPNIHTFNTSGCIVNLENGKSAVIDGLKDFIVAESDDILMICPKNKENNVKLYADLFNKKSR